MKVRKKFLAMVLAVEMLMSLSMTAFAKESVQFSTYKNQIELGDLFEYDVTNEKTDRVIITFKNEEAKEKFKQEKKSDFVVHDTDEIAKNTKNGNKKQRDRHRTVISSNNEKNTDELISEVKKEYGNEVVSIQPDYKINFFTNTNDEEEIYANIDNENDKTIRYEDNDGIIVAVIDTGIDIKHEAFSDKICTNSAEIYNGLDDDENGYIDDVNGWSFIDNIDMSAIKLDSNHGTHVSGLIAAEGIGVATNSKILPLQVFKDGQAYTSDIIKAIEYAEDAGAKIVNCSWGTTEENPALKETIENSEMLFIAAVGNNAINIDEHPIYPASYDLDNIIAVGASNDRDYLAYFSNYGTNVDVVANGYKVKSAIAHDQYGIMMGTSMSAAYVSGVAALVYNESAVNTKNIVITTSDKISTLSGKINEGRRVNVKNAISGKVTDDIIKNSLKDYGCEYNENDATTSNGFELYELEPEPIQISAGANHSLILNNWGNVFSFGDNSFGQLGKKQETDEYIQNAVAGLEQIEKISTYANHNMALQDGLIYVWGDNSKDQLGTISDEYTDIPMPIDIYSSESYSEIIDIAAGGWYSLALDDRGNVWAWGDNRYGQLARGYDGYTSQIPQIAISGVDKMSAGKYHILALKNGKVYGWGRNGEDYPLGKTANWAQSTPIQIEGLPNNIVDITAGDKSSFFITDEGRVYALGLNNNGQLGDGTTTSKSTPVLLDIKDVKSIESNGTTIFLKNNGEVYVCGANTYGQLGLGHVNTRYTTPTKVHGENFTKITSGFTHNLLFRCNEEYTLDFPEKRAYKGFAMGCNDFGQCGVVSDGNIAYPTIVRQLTYMNPEYLTTIPKVSCESDEEQCRLNPVDAIYVAQNGADSCTNFYDSEILKISYTGNESNSNNNGAYSYLKFDTDNIPKERVVSAKLFLNVENNGDKSESIREIGVYDTYKNTWNGQMMTWDEGRVKARELLGTFNVTASGYRIEDAGWHEVDITNYIQNNIDDDLSLMLKMNTTKTYETVITSGTAINPNENMPTLVITYKREDATKAKRYERDVLADTYISQHGEDNTTNFAQSEYLNVNYTGKSSGNTSWGQDAYLNFDVGSISDIDKKYMKSATLWLYVDENSDVRDSIREITVSGNYGIQYDAQSMSWNSGRATGECILGSFNVEGNGYEIITPGWKKIDVTDFIASSTETKVEFILKMSSTKAHPVKIRSNEYSFEDTRPRLVIDFGDIPFQFNKKIELDCVEAEDYAICIQNNNIESEYTEIYYDSSKLTLVDMDTSTTEIESEIGTYETITILDNKSDYINFSSNQEYIILKFKALKSENACVYVN